MRDDQLPSKCSGRDGVVDDVVITVRMLYSSLNNAHKKVASRLKRSY